MLSLPFRKIRDKVMKGGSKRMLIKVNVLGSSGPVRFVVNEDATVAVVIETALKSYAHEGRFPVLGTNYKEFFLYTPNIGPEDSLDGVRASLGNIRPPYMWHDEGW
ncbi:hypothetical protein M8C21_003049 [Ambrosia artemisiifolia]|uniref:DUF7054 domain-containing protein n=1 Tax=Ambrosia artemisiifolia TaxID=4212 RepID=A0AAD5GPS7_AMBAR|nr:hypothetical protein M8C21_003049 [Ambrosia artemisiifolia]